MPPHLSRILKPVILPVPEKARRMHPREKVEFLSRHARRALQLCAEQSGIELGELAKDPDGIPLPSNGHYWSVTHKPGYVAAVASPEPVGIDLEEIRDIHRGLYRRVAGEDEWQLTSNAGGRRVMFFRFWTAKEAVMKAAGTGIKDLSRIKIVQVVDQNHIDLVFQETTWKVQQNFFDNHIAAITANRFAVDWSIL